MSTPSGNLQLVGCPTIAQPFGCTWRSPKYGANSRDHTSRPARRGLGVACRAELAGRGRAHRPAPGRRRPRGRSQRLRRGGRGAVPARLLVVGPGRGRDPRRARARTRRRRDDRAGGRVAPAGDARPVRRGIRSGGAAAPAAGAPGALMGAADAVFSALSDGTRRNLLARLGELGEASATDLARELPVSRQAVHKHLGMLSAAGLVATRRSGREVLYHPTPAPMSEAMAWMAEVGGQWDERLAA